jgi:hypothetical protein
MSERLNTPEEAYNFKFGAALTMERTVLEILDANTKQAQDEQVANLFRHHHAETEGHVRTLQEAFALFGWKVDDSPCPGDRRRTGGGEGHAKKTTTCSSTPCCCRARQRSSTTKSGSTRT